MLSKIFRVFGIRTKPMVPLSAHDIVTRSRHASKTIEWSRNKRLTIYNPPFWGIHHLFIDPDLHHALIALKEDGNSFVFYVNSQGAERWEKYDENLNMCDCGIVENQALTWLIYEDYVIYNGAMLPATNAPYHWGRVIDNQPFYASINEKWASQGISEIRELAPSYAES